MSKNILIVGLNSELAQETIKELKIKDYKIWATSRQIGMMDEKIKEIYLDVCNEESFFIAKEKLKDISFDTIINFTGIAIAGAVEELNEIELKKQLDVNLFGLLKIIKYFCPSLKSNGKLVNISSMASYGIFPFLSPYCISKSSADILLNTYAIESKKKVVSIRPGAVATKFWDKSIELNKKVFENEKTKFKNESDFLVKNAQKNSLHAKNSINVAKQIAKIIDLENPKTVYNIGLDSKIAKLSRFFSQNIVNSIVNLALKSRIKNI